MTKCKLSMYMAALAATFAFGIAPASAGVDDPLFTFGFTDLDGDYNDHGDSTGTFTVQASSEASGGPFNSAGDVTRVLDPSGTANFDVGFVDLGTQADLQLEFDISDVGKDFARGTAEFTITDADGDSITGDINGMWERLGGDFASFEGIATNVALNTDGNGQFDGPSGGSWDMGLPFGPFYNGAVIVLETGNWFTSSFMDGNTQIEASIVPVPSAALLAAIGIGVVARRRRTAL